MNILLIVALFQILEYLLEHYCLHNLKKQHTILLLYLLEQKVNRSKHHLNCPKLLIDKQPILFLQLKDKLIKVDILHDPNHSYHMHDQQSQLLQQELRKTSSFKVKPTFFLQHLLVQLPKVCSYLPLLSFFYPYIQVAFLS